MTRVTRDVTMEPSRVDGITRVGATAPRRAGPREEHLRGIRPEADQVGDKSVAWDDSFRLFFTTKLGNPHYSPEVMAKTMLIGYSVTGRSWRTNCSMWWSATKAPIWRSSFRELVADMSANAF